MKSALSLRIQFHQQRSPSQYASVVLSVVCLTGINDELFDATFTQSRNILWAFNQFRISEKWTFNPGDIKFNNKHPNGQCLQRDGSMLGVFHRVAGIMYSLTEYSQLIYFH